MNTTEMMQKIEAIDLEAIKMKLMHEQSGEGWTAARANAMEGEYRRFLYMMHTYPQEHFAPLVDVDTFWHYHILDTRKYAADCETTFGHFLHHHPYVGLGDSGDDAAEHVAYGQRMHELYRSTFGEACLTGSAAWCSLAAKGKDEATAWCSLAARAASKNSSTAWCSLNDAGKKATQTAWCSLSGERKHVAATAWCSLASGPVQAPATAWCSIASEIGKAGATAWCSIVSKPSLAVAALAA